MIPVLALCATVLPGCAQTPAAQPVNAASTSVASSERDSTGPGINTASCSRPVYPRDALARRSEGTTTMRFLINPDGTVAQSSVQKSSGDVSLDEAAWTALSKCRFRPPVAGGKPVRAWVPVQYVWTLDPKG